LSASSAEDIHRKLHIDDVELVFMLGTVLRLTQETEVPIYTIGQILAALKP